jgi:hypothetical protein
MNIYGNLPSTLTKVTTFAVLQILIYKVVFCIYLMELPCLYETKITRHIGKLNKSIIITEHFKAPPLLKQNLVLLSGEA